MHSYISPFIHSCIHSLIQVSDEFKRVRAARYIHPDGVVRNYDAKEAEGQRILSQVEKGRFAVEDIYMLHEHTLDRKVFMVTNNRVLQLGSGLGAGTWTVDWEFQFNKIQGPPPVLQVKMSRGKKSQTYFVNCSRNFFQTFKFLFPIHNDFKCKVHIFYIFAKILRSTFTESCHKIFFANALN